MKIALIIFCLTGSVFAESFSGVGSTRNMLGLPPSEFTFTLDYPSVEKEPRPPATASDLGAVQDIGTIKIKFSSGPEIKFTFYITQFPSEQGFSLVGFYITDGYPHVLKIDIWSSDKKFYLYESFRSPDAVLTGKFLVTK